MAEPDTDRAILNSEIVDRIADSQDHLLEAWAGEIVTSQVLRVREDLEGEGPPEDLLRSLFPAVISQLRAPDDYLILRRAVRSGATEGLTPDAACRFLLTFKQVVVQFVRETDEAAETVEAIRNAFDEMLVRIAQFTHEKRHEEIRTLERGQRKVLGFDQDRLQTLLDTMNEGLISVDNLETITTFNREMERITGYERGEMVGRHIFTLYPPEKIPDVREQLGKRRRGESSTFTSHIKHKNGLLVPVRISGAPLHDGEDQHVGSFAVVTDVRITGRRRCAPVRRAASSGDCPALFRSL